MKLFATLALAVGTAAAQTSMGPIKSPQVNQTIYVGQSGYPTIQSAVNYGCHTGSTNYAVIVQTGMNPADTPSAITGGCTGVYIIDQRTSFTNAWAWNGSAYTVSVPYIIGNGFYTGYVIATRGLPTLPAGAPTSGFAFMDSPLSVDEGRLVAVGKTTAQVAGISLEGLSAQTGTILAHQYMNCAPANNYECIFGGQVVTQVVQSIANSDLFNSGSLRSNGRRMARTGNDGIANASAAGYLDISQPAESVSTENPFVSLANAPPTHFSSRVGGAVLDYFHNYSGDAKPNYCDYSLSAPTPTTIVQNNCGHIQDLNAAPGVLVGGILSVHVSDRVDSTNLGNGIAQARSTGYYKTGLGDGGGHYLYCNMTTGEHDSSAEGNVCEAAAMSELAGYRGTITAHTANTVSTNTTGGYPGIGRILISRSEINGQGQLSAGTDFSGVHSMNTTDSHSVSTAWGTIGACGTQTNLDQPQSATCSLTVTSGTFNTSHTVCVADYVAPEQVAVTSVGGGNIVMNLGWPHPASTVIYQGGMCGYYFILGLGATDPSAAQYAATYMAVGSRTTTSFDYVYVFKQGQNGNVTVTIPNFNTAISNMTRSGSTVTAYGYGPASFYNFVGLNPPAGTTISVQGSSDSTFNGPISGSVTIASGGGAINYTQAGAGTSSSGGTMYLANYNNYAAYCGAVVSKVLGATFQNPWGNGQFQVLPNNCVWTNGQAAFEASDPAQDWLAKRELVIAQNSSNQAQQYVHINGLSGAAMQSASHWLVSTDDNPNSFIGYGGTFPGHHYADVTDILYQGWNFSQPPNPNGYLFAIGPYSGSSTWAGMQYPIFTLGASSGNYCQWGYNTASSGNFYNTCPMVLLGDITSYANISTRIVSASTSINTNQFTATGATSLPATTTINGVLSSDTLIAQAIGGFSNNGNVNSVTCTSATCTLGRGTVAVVTNSGFTAAGNLFWINYDTSATGPLVCTVNQAGGQTYYGINHDPSTPTTRLLVTVEASGGAPSTTINVDYRCSY